LILTALWMMFTACGDAPASAVRGPLDVHALSFPAAWVAERIGGDRVHVTVFPPAGADPSFWQPPPEGVASLTKADLIVAVGAGYEAWTATAALPDPRVVHLAKGADLIQLAATHHSHGAQGAHEHVGVDPHIWLDPELLGASAMALAERLAIADPAGNPAYFEAAKRLLVEVKAVDDAWRDALGALEGAEVAANHPTWSYWARRYGFSVRVFDVAPDQAPAPEVVAAVQAWQAAHPAGRFLWESPPAPATLAALPGLRSIVLDPLEQPAASGRYDWLAGARADLDVLRHELPPVNQARQ
jgi:zinc transport system substrate-binding protein